MLTGSGFAEEFHMRWFWDSEPASDVFIRSQASTLTGFSLSGPNARTLLQRLTRTDLSPAGFKLFAITETAVGMSPVILGRAGFTGELGHELWTTPDFQATLYDELFEAGHDLGREIDAGGQGVKAVHLSPPPAGPGQGGCSPAAPRRTIRPDGPCRRRARPRSAGPREG